MSRHVTRIFSDIHYSEPGGRVRSLSALKPLCSESDTLILNGDTLDTRPGPAAARTAALKEQVGEFFANSPAKVQFLTGNHDPDISSRHYQELGDGAVLVTHGDLIYEDIVPWSTQAPQIRACLEREFASAGAPARTRFEDLLLIHRRVCAALPQHDHLHRRGFRAIYGYLRETVWPPSRMLQIIRAWREAPTRAARLLANHRPTAKFILVGHTHHPGIWRRNGRVVINTGSFHRPFGSRCVDLDGDKLTVRRVVSVRGEFRAGPAIAEFSLAQP